MPEGPWGGPRITTLLPFSSDEVDVVFEEDRIGNGVLTPEAEKLLNTLDKDIDNWVKVERRVIVKQEPEKTGFGIVDEFNDFLSSLGKRAAGIVYYVFENEVGYIANVWVERRFRRKGIATEMRKGAMDDMEQLGVDVIYSFPATDAGEQLARDFGFVESDVAPGYLEKRFSR